MLKEHEVCPILSLTLLKIFLSTYMRMTLDIGLNLGSRKVENECVSPAIFEKIDHRHEILFYHE